LPSVIISISSADLSRADELQPMMWALWVAPCLIITCLPLDSRYCFTFGIRSMYWIVAARDIVLPFRVSISFRLMSLSLSFRFVSIYRGFMETLENIGF